VQKVDVLAVLKQVIDPHIGVNIVDLGFIYDVKVNGKKVMVDMTLTTPVCPMSSILVAQVEEQLKEAGFEPEVKLVFDPPWTPDRMSKDLKQRLGVL